MWKRGITTAQTRLIKPQILPDVLRQGIINLGVTRHWLLLAGGWVGINVVTLAMAHQDATRFR